MRREKKRQVKLIVITHYRLMEVHTDYKIMKLIIIYHVMIDKCI